MSKADLWSDGSQWILYIENTAIIRQIKNWNAYRDGRIREMAEYFDSKHSQPFAVQFRLNASIRHRILKLLDCHSKPN